MERWFGWGVNREKCNDGEIVEETPSKVGHLLTSGMDCGSTRPGLWLHVERNDW